MAFTLQNRVRIVTAAALFDGHDAAINIMRRLMQRAGAEVIHLGHNRSAAEIVDAAVMEDAQAVAITSYQGGHVEFFKYVVDLLKERAAPHVRIFGGGGGVIVEDEIRELEAYGVTKIYSPEDGRKMGLKGMIEHLVKESDFETPRLPARNGRLVDADTRRIASILTQAENGGVDGLSTAPATVPVVGLTGPGGAGKSVMTDELLRRFLLEFPGRRAAILSVDPSRKRTGGALLGDRIRMNCIRPERVFMRSFATRGSGTELSSAIGGAIQVCKAAGYDLVFVETSGIGQGGTGITDVSDIACYVMTPEYGAASQLEKIDMLDFADVVAVNKCDRRGAEDALRDVRKQLRRNREIGATVPDEELPVFGTIASRFNDTGVNRLFTHLFGLLDEKLGTGFLKERTADLPDAYHDVVIVPPDRERYLGEISQCVREYRQAVERKAAAATRLYRLQGAADALGGEAPPDLAAQIEAARAAVGADALGQLEAWEALSQRYRAEELVREVRGRELRGPLFENSL
ncbi:MAG: cobalamin-dependent protein, partial [Planctomycetota bacterium]